MFVNNRYLGILLDPVHRIKNAEDLALVPLCTKAHDIIAKSVVHNRFHYETYEVRDPKRSKLSYLLQVIICRISRGQECML